jgi:hypothetical protein
MLDRKVSASGAVSADVPTAGQGRELDTRLCKHYNQSRPHFLYNPKNHFSRIRLPDIHATRSPILGSLRISRTCHASDPRPNTGNNSRNGAASLVGPLTTSPRSSRRTQRKSRGFRALKAEHKASRMPTAVRCSMGWLPEIRFLMALYTRYGVSGNILQRGHRARLQLQLTTLAHEDETLRAFFRAWQHGVSRAEACNISTQGLRRAAELAWEIRQTELAN